MIRVLVAFAALAAVVLASAPASAQSGPNVRRFNDGAYEVRFQNGCRVTYNTSGRRGGSQGCRPKQVERADRLVQQDAAAPGGGGLRLRRLNTGAGRVTFNDGCVVTYNREGRRSGSNGCRPKQVQRADRYVQANW